MIVRHRFLVRPRLPPRVSHRTITTIVAIRVVIMTMNIRILVAVPSPEQKESYEDAHEPTKE